MEEEYIWYTKDIYCGMWELVLVGLTTPFSYLLKLGAIIAVAVNLKTDAEKITSCEKW